MATHPQPSTPRSLLFSAACSWAGALVCFLLINASVSGHHLFCARQSDCEAVLASPFSVIMGVPLSWLGAGYYVGLLVLLLLALAVNSPPIRRKILQAALWINVASLTFSAGLVYLQFNVIHAFCSLCVVSAVILLVLTGGLGMAVRADAEDFHGAPGMSVALAAFAAIGFAGWHLATHAPEDEIVAEVGAAKFLRRQMDRDLRQQAQPLKGRMYALETEWVQNKIDATLLALEAKKRGVAVEDLVAKIGPPPASGSAPASTAQSQARRQFLEELSRKYGARSFLASHRRGPVAIDLTKAEITGPPDARVELVVFSDFTCKFCIELAPVLNKVREKFPTEVLVAHRDFPLGHSGAGFTAAVAGRCAAEQGAFWAYHDRLFAENGALPEEKLLSIAMELGMDGPRFTQCLHSEKAKAAVTASSKEALDIGVPGSPALYLNGVLIGGMMDSAALEKKIREELNRAHGQETP